MASDEMGESASGDDLWRLIGPVTELSKKRCRLIYSCVGSGGDVCLFHVDGEFFAMDARCAHSGGPLCDGDIEDTDGILRVFCPWHDYDFNIRTGTSQTGLKQKVHRVKVEDGTVYIQHSNILSLQPSSSGTKH